MRTLPFDVTDEVYDESPRRFLGRTVQCLSQVLGGTCVSGDGPPGRSTLVGLATPVLLKYGVERSGEVLLKADVRIVKRRRGRGVHIRYESGGYKIDKPRSQV